MPDLNKPNESQPPYSAPGQNPPPPPPPPYGGQQPPYGGQQPPYGGQQPPYGGPPAQIPGAEKKLPAALCGILLNGLGVHKFLLGYNTEGIIMLVAFFGGFILCGIPSLIVAVIGIIEGVIYLTKSDEQFVQEYIVNKKPWF